MAWPRTVRMNLLVLLLVIVSLSFLVQLSVALSGVAVWTLLAISAVVALTSVAVGWYRRAETHRDAARSDAPSFGDMLRRRHASEVPEL